MKIGITGTHSTGKTTLLNALRSEEQFKNYKFCDEVTRWVKSLGIDINEDGSDTSQKLIMMKHIENLFMNDNMITDRISLDGLVYSTWLHEEGKLSSDTLNYVQRVYDKTIDQYDYIFYLTPDFDIVADGVRSIDGRFRKDIAAHFHKIYLANTITMHHIQGSVRQRVEKILEVINNNKEKQ